MQNLQDIVNIVHSGENAMSFYTRDWTFDVHEWLGTICVSQYLLMFFRQKNIHVPELDLLTL